MGGSKPGSGVALGKKTPAPCKTKRSDVRSPSGIQLAGPCTMPGEILPLLKELQHDATARSKELLVVHVLAQISYKEGCLKAVVNELKTSDDREGRERNAHGRNY